MDKNLVFISITVDPDNATPSALKEYAQKNNVEKGWHLLSGKKENIELVLTKLSKNVESREQHDAIILIGNLDTRLWKKVKGIARIKR